MSNPRTRTQMVSLKAEDGTSWLFTREDRSTPSSYGRRFVIMFQDARELAKAIRSTTGLRLFNDLPWMLSPSDYRRLDQQVLAKDLGTSQPVISRALSELVGLGILERQGKGPGVRYRLSPLVAWRGTAGQYFAQEREEKRNYRAEACGMTLRAQLTLRLTPTDDED